MAQKKRKKKSNAHLIHALSAAIKIEKGVKIYL